MTAAPPRSHPARPPDICALLQALVARDIRFVLVGSVAAKVYGVETEPGDLDITPACDAENLSRLAALLEEIEAAPGGGFGRWEVQPDGERRWVAHEPTAEDLAARARWKPDPGDPSSMDSLFHTRLGNFDVVPDLTGSYETLERRARRMEACGVSIWVAHVDELLAPLTVARRAKDLERVRRLREIQRSLD